MEQITLRIEIEISATLAKPLDAETASTRRAQVVGLLAEVIAAVHRARHAPTTGPVEDGDEVGDDE